jgi:hypothetical protein
MRSLTRWTILAAVVVMLGGLVTTPAHAKKRSVGSPSGAYTQINQGTVDLGFFDSLLLLRHYKSTADDSSTLYFAMLGGFSPRYFVIDNLAIGLNLNLFYQQQWTHEGNLEVSAKDTGFIGHVTAHYFVGVGSSFFWKPGIGGGGFFGKHTIPVDGSGLLAQSNTYGGSLRLDLGFAYWVGKNFNLRAGPELLLRFGVDQPVDAEGRSFVSFDAGLSVGFGYSF